jgi:signal transduction histidine kinase
MIQQTHPDLAQLQLRNQQLCHQVQQLLAAERQMQQAQAQADHQIRLYRQLHEVSKHLNAASSSIEILDLVIRFGLDDLHFERGLVLRYDDLDAAFQPELWEGYGIDAPSCDRLCADHDSLLPLLESHCDCLVHTGLPPTDLGLATLARQFGLDEYLVATLSSSATTLPYLIILGNTTALHHATVPMVCDRAELIDPDLWMIFSNLLSQAGAALEQTALYLEASDRAENLRHAMLELHKAQSQLVQNEKMSALGQLVAGVAHEINNPVNFISGNLEFTEQYTQGILDLLQAYQALYPHPEPSLEQMAAAIDLPFLLADLPHMIRSMKVGTTRIQEIVLSLRNFSRMDESMLKSVDVHEGIDSTLMILQHRLKAVPAGQEPIGSQRPPIQITKLYGELPPVECYAGQLNQVFMNLLSNAIDAIDESILAAAATGSPGPEIQIETLMVNEYCVQIQIRDTGAGIPEAVQSRLFDPFFTTKPIGKGTGMGLSISYQIIADRHGGSLQCASTPGKGSTFCIMLPLRQEQRRRPSRFNQPLKPPAPIGESTGMARLIALTPNPSADRG